MIEKTYIVRSIDFKKLNNEKIKYKMLVRKTQMDQI